MGKGKLRQEHEEKEMKHCPVLSEKGGLNKREEGRDSKRRRGSTEDASWKQNRGDKWTEQEGTTRRKGMGHRTKNRIKQANTEHRRKAGVRKEQTNERQNKHVYRHYTVDEMYE